MKGGKPNMHFRGAYHGPRGVIVLPRCGYSILGWERRPTRRTTLNHDKVTCPKCLKRLELDATIATPLVLFAIAPSRPAPAADERLAVAS